jgi:hypothetical protein
MPGGVAGEQLTLPPMPIIASLSLALRQIMFPVWVTFDKRYWVTLS